MLTAPVDFPGTLAPLANGIFAVAVLQGNQTATIPVMNSGSNVVTASGGNATGLSTNIPDFSFGQGQGVLAAGEHRLPTSGGAALVIR